MARTRMRRCLRLATVALAGGFAAAAHAAGGHHGVDDAAILAPRECGQETWFTRGHGVQLLHAGLNCGAGPVELAGAFERTRQDDEGAIKRWNLEVKWAHALSDSLAVGADVQPYWVLPTSRYGGTLAYAVVSWKATDRLAVHADFGRDFAHAAPGERIAGVALEYTHDKRRSFVVEHYEEQRTQFLRVGPRWTIVDAVTVDFSRSLRLSGPAPSTWTIGLTFELAPD